MPVPREALEQFLGIGARPDHVLLVATDRRQGEKDIAIARMLRFRLTQDAQGAGPVATALQGQGIDIAVVGIAAFRFGSLAQPLQGFAAALL